MSETCSLILLLNGQRRQVWDIAVITTVIASGMEDSRPPGGFLSRLIEKVFHRRVEGGTSGDLLNFTRCVFLGRASKINNGSQGREGQRDRQAVGL